MIAKSAFALLAAGLLAAGAGFARAQTAPPAHGINLDNVYAQANNNNQQKKPHNTVVKKPPNNAKFNGPKGGNKKPTVTTNTHHYKKPTGGNTTVKTYQKPKATVKTYHGPNTTVKTTNVQKGNVHVMKNPGPHAKQVTTHRLRGLSATGTGHAYIRGRNFSTWRNGRYRRRYHNAWITFVPLSILAAILIDERQYYAYAYIDAPEDYCYGRTEDGCQLVWDDIEMLEGELVGQCVAYCPWRD